MQEITRWVADDGKEFEFEEDCENYECECIFKLMMQEPCIKFFDSQLDKIIFDDYDDFCSRSCDVAYIMGGHSLDNFLTMEVNGVELGDRADFPMYGEWWGSDDEVIAWNEETEEWDNLSYRFKELHKTLKKIAES